MPTYGPWIQDDDYTAENTAAAQAGGRWRTEYAEVDGPYGGVSAGTYTSMSLDRNNEPAVVSYFAEPTLGETKFAFHWVQDIVGLFDPDGRSAILDMRELYKVISASPYTDGVAYYWPGSDIGPGVPPDAIGFQWEGDEPSFDYPLWAPAEVLGLTISGHMDAEFKDSMNTADVNVLSPGSEFVVAVVADPGESWDSGSEPPDPVSNPDDDFTDSGEWDPTNTAGGPGAAAVITNIAGPVAEDYSGGGQSVEFSVDPGLLDPMGRVMLYTQMDFGAEGPLAGPTSEPSSPPGITGTLGYGYHFSAMTATWTLRPRRYRWIFENSVAPPWRLFPRDDSLRNSPRLYPPPTTRQRSDRISGTW